MSRPTFDEYQAEMKKRKAEVIRKRKTILTKSKKEKEKDKQPD